MPSKACAPNCKCGRHKGGTRKKSTQIYERPGTQCVVVEDGKRCERGIRSLKQGLCGTHYARLLRNGTVYLPKRPLKVDPASVRRREYKRKYDKMKKQAEEDSLNDPCMCGCKREQHGAVKTKFSGHCRTYRCNCKRFDAANKDKFKGYKEQIATLAFVGHIGETATCEKCAQTITIGKWYDPFMLRRALLHRRRECPANYRKTTKLEPGRTSPETRIGVGSTYG